MIDIHIDNTLKEATQYRVALGLLRAEITVTEHDPELWLLIESTSKKILAQEIADITALPEIKALRETYKYLGKSPARYRGSNEALLRRIMQGKGLYQVNTIVDINNLLSISSKRSLGSYDCNQLQGDITLRAGHPGETYKGIGKEQINLESLPILVDHNGPFGNPTSDSERAKITLDTTSLMMVIFGFDGKENLDTQLNQAREWLITFANATQIETQILE